MKQTSTMVRWASGVNVGAALWLLAAPHALNYAAMTQALWNDSIVGGLLLLLAMPRLLQPHKRAALSWLGFALGTWLLVAPFLLTYGALTGLGSPGAAIGNDLIVGVVVMSMAAWSARRTNALAGTNGSRRVEVNVSERSG